MELADKPLSKQVAILMDRKIINCIDFHIEALNNNNDSKFDIAQ